MGPRASSGDRDADGVPDDEERVLGLDPDVPNVPEPLLFDMVRGLGARRGELEANALVVATPRGAEPVSGGPEMEWVFARGYGLEVELPVSTRGVEAWKGSLQGTLPAPLGGGMGGATSFQHGWLVTGEVLVGDPGARVTALYLAAVRFDARWSALAMIGGRHEKERGTGSRSSAVVNPSVFFDASTRLTLGLELNGLLEVDGTTDLVVLPQVHWQASRAWKAQVGAGGHVDEAGAGFLSALRLSCTF